MSNRILHVVESIEPEPGSVAILLRGLVAELRKAGMESDLIGSKAGFDGGEAVGGAPSGRDDPEAIGRSDIVHVHGWSGPMTKAAVRAAVHLRKPVVLSPLGGLPPDFHGPGAWRSRLRWMLGEGRAVKRAAVLAAANEMERRRLVEQTKGLRCEVLAYGLCAANGIAEDGLPPPQREDVPAGRCLLVLGPIDPREGLVVLLKAFAELGADADGWWVALVGPGRGAWRGMLEAAVRRKGGEGRVVFASATGEREQQAWLRRAAALVCLSPDVGRSVSLMQAALAGVPALAAEACVPDALRETTCVCSPTRAGVREALRALLTKEDAERAALGERSREVMAGALDWRALIPRYRQLYDQLQ